MFISSCVSSTENLIVSSICYNRSHFISKLMLMAIFVIISSFDENSVCFIFAFAVKVMMLMPSAWYFRNAWCFLWDSAEYLCLLHHTKLPQSSFFFFFSFFSFSPIVGIVNFNSSLFYIIQPFLSITISKKKSFIHSFRGFFASPWWWKMTLFFTICAPTCLQFSPSM